MAGSTPRGLAGDWNSAQYQIERALHSVDELFEARLTSPGALHFGPMVAILDKAVLSLEDVSEKVDELVVARGGCCACLSYRGKLLLSSVLQTIVTVTTGGNFIYNNLISPSSTAGIWISGVCTLVAPVWSKVNKAAVRRIIATEEDRQILLRMVEGRGLIESTRAFSFTLQEIEARQDEFTPGQLREVLSACEVPQLFATHVSDVAMRGAVAAVAGSRVTSGEVGRRAAERIERLRGDALEEVRRRQPVKAILAQELACPPAERYRRLRRGYETGTILSEAQMGAQLARTRTLRRLPSAGERRLRVADVPALRVVSPSEGDAEGVPMMERGARAAREEQEARRRQEARELDEALAAVERELEEARRRQEELARSVREMRQAQMEARERSVRADVEAAASEVSFDRSGIERMDAESAVLDRQCAELEARRQAIRREQEGVLRRIGETDHFEAGRHLDVRDAAAREEAKSARGELSDLSDLEDDELTSSSDEEPFLMDSPDGEGDRASAAAAYRGSPRREGSIHVLSSAAGATSAAAVVSPRALQVDLAAADAVGAADMASRELRVRGVARGSQTARDRLLAEFMMGVQRVASTTSPDTPDTMRAAAAAFDD